MNTTAEIQSKIFGFLLGKLPWPSEIFRNDRKSSESGRKLLDVLNKITLPFLELFLFPSG